MRSAEELRGRLQVNFQGEEGIDAGGLTREWYLVLSREIFNPNYALFTPATGNEPPFLLPPCPVTLLSCGTFTSSTYSPIPLPPFVPPYLTSTTHTLLIW